MADNKAGIIDRLIEVRAETGLLSKDFAAKAGIDPKNYSSIESGKRSIGGRVMNDICHAFNISAVWLKTGKGEKYVTTVSPNDTQSDNIYMPREVFDQITRLTIAVSEQQKERSEFLEVIKSQQRTIENLSQKGAAAGAKGAAPKAALG